MNSLIQKLDWDTEYLGVAVTKIIPPTLDLATLQACLNTLREQKIQLVYWAVPADASEAIEAARYCGGILVDDKITYAMALSAAKIPAASYDIYPQQMPEEDLFTLGFASGDYSRFRQDPHLTEAQFKAVYRKWMINSTLQRIAQAVLVIRREGRLAGMVTVGEKNQRGDIGLLAVVEQARGQGIGAQLVYAAQNYFVEHGYQQSQVVTQQINLPACRLYEKCGYCIDKVEKFFHFWL